MSLKNLIFLFVLTFTFPFMNAQEPTSLKTRTLELTTQIAYITIEGMACQEGCADTISKNLKETQGVQSAEVSYETGKAIIKFNDSFITLQKIEDIITGTKVKDYVYSIKNSTLKNQIVR